MSNFLQQNNYKLWKNFRIFRVFDFSIRAKIENSETLEIPKFPQIKEIHSNSEVLKKFPSFPSFRFQYKGQNRKVGNLGNFRHPQIKKIPWNLQLGNLGSFQIFTVNKTESVFEYSGIFQVCLVEAHQCINTFFKELGKNLSPLNF